MEPFISENFRVVKETHTGHEDKYKVEFKSHDGNWLNTDVRRRSLHNANEHAATSEELIKHRTTVKHPIEWDGLADIDDRRLIDIERFYDSLTDEQRKMVDEIGKNEWHKGYSQAEEVYGRNQS